MLLALEERAAEREARAGAREERAALAEEARLARREAREMREAAGAREAREEAREARTAREAREVAREAREVREALELTAERRELALERTAERRELALERTAERRELAAEARESRTGAAEAQAALARELRAGLAAFLAVGAQRVALPGTAHSGSPATHSGSPAGAAAAAAAGGAGGSEGGAGGGRSSHGSGASSPLKGQGRKALASDAQVALLAAFAAAAKPLAPLPALPFPASLLAGLGLSFAHRLCPTIGGALNIAPARADFSLAPGTRELLPQAAGGGAHGAGMSFFLVTCEQPAVVKAAHTFRGTVAGGCYCYPLGALPPQLSLVVDKVQVSDAHGSPVLLHASLAPAQPMGEADFLAALRQWQGVMLCSIEGAGGAQQVDCLFEADGEGAREGSCSGASALVASAAAKLATLVHGQARPAVAPPAGGSPGTQQ